MNSLVALLYISGIVAENSAEPRCYAHANIVQQPLEEHHRLSRFGQAVCSIPDIDADGLPEIAVAAPFAGDEASPRGTVMVFSSAKGALISRITNDTVSLRLGVSLAAGPPIDRAARGVLAIGARSLAPDSQSKVLMANPQNGEVVTTLGDPFAPAKNRKDTGFSTALAFVGDFDGDGVTDLAVGAPDASAARGGPATGAVAIFSTATGKLLWRAYGPPPQEVADGTQPGLFGFSLCGITDFNKDQIPDMIVGVPNRTLNGVPVGQVVYLSGRDGKELRTLDGQKQGALGYSLASCQTGKARQRFSILAGAPHNYCMLLPSLIDETAVVVDELDPGGYAEGFGGSVCWVMDVNNDSIQDAVVGCMEPDDEGDAYYLAIVSGADGKVLKRLDTEHRCTIVQPTGDMNKDGIGDLIIGMPSHDEVYLLSGAYSKSAVDLQSQGILLRLSAGF